MSVNGFGETPGEEKARYDRDTQMGEDARYNYNQQGGGGNGSGSGCIVVLLVFTAAMSSISYSVYSLLA